MLKRSMKISMMLLVEPISQKLLWKMKLLLMSNLRLLKGWTLWREKLGVQEVTKRRPLRLPRAPRYKNKSSRKPAQPVNRAPNPSPYYHHLQSLFSAIPPVYDD